MQAIRSGSCRTASMAAPTPSAIGRGTRPRGPAGPRAQIKSLPNANGGSTDSYSDAADTPSAGARLTLSINDNGNRGAAALTGSDTANINVSTVNDAPVATITPATYSATEQVSLN